MNENQPKRILYIDDDLGLARLFKTKIERLGYAVEHAKDGESGLQRLREQSFDLVAVDHLMPGVHSGLDVISEIQGFDDPPPLIMITGKGCERTAAQALKLGAHDYIVKDVEGVYFELLPSVIKQVFRKRALEEDKQKAKIALEQSEACYRNLVELSPTPILVLIKGAISFLNRSALNMLSSESNADPVGMALEKVLPEKDRALFRDYISKQAQAPVGTSEIFDTELITDKHRFHVELVAIPLQQKGKPGLQCVIRDISGRKEEESALNQMNLELESILRDRTTQLENLHRQMYKLSRGTPQDYKATDVLHNVKNVLNSLMVGTTIMDRILDRSKLDNVARLAALLKEQGPNLGKFMTEDEKGRTIPDFLLSLAGILDKEHRALRDEVAGLADHLEHINMTIALQQSQARLGNELVPVKLDDLLNEALTLTKNAVSKANVVVNKKVTPHSAFKFNRHQVLQILVNMIINAVKALEECPNKERNIHLEVLKTTSDQIEISVTDNGVGIPAEHLDKIFSYGFTTRKTGHGFGLHSCLNLARDMGGDLSVASEGLGAGATFKLTLPFKESSG